MDYYRCVDGTFVSYLNEVLIVTVALILICNVCIDYMNQSLPLMYLPVCSFMQNTKLAVCVH